MYSNIEMHIFHIMQWIYCHVLSYSNACYTCKTHVKYIVVHERMQTLPAVCSGVP